MESRSEQLRKALGNLISANSADIVGAVVVGSDGIVLGAHMNGETNIDRVAAITATMMGVTSRVAGELKIGTAEESIVRAGQGYLLVMPVAPNIILSMTLRQNANLGMVRIEARETGRIIAAAMGVSS